MIRADYEPGGPAKYQVKDTSTALRFLVDQGGGELDHSAVLLELERRNPRETKHSLS